MYVKINSFRQLNYVIKYYYLVREQFVMKDVNSRIVHL